ncbi:MAG: (d)CMP kinase [Phycisphaeraceae bacterium]|nr:(d)CMP kinase [Phycisphaeraceae bacterium]
MQSSRTSQPVIGQRVAVIGCSGSGKSTLAESIAEAKGLSYIQSDALYWMAGWVQRPEPEFLQLLEEHVSVESWALDGNIGGREQVVLPRADTVIWLDFPRSVVMRRLLRRTVRRAWTKEPIFHDNAESWRMSFASKDSILLYAWRSHGRIRQQYETLWPTLDDSIHKHRVRSQAELDALLKQAML